MVEDAALVLDMGTAEVVRTHAAQDTLCGFHRSQPGAGPQHPGPQITHFLLKFRVHISRFVSIKVNSIEKFEERSPPLSLKGEYGNINDTITIHGIQ